MGKRILVTGGAGFIGSNLVHRLVDGGLADDVTVLDDLSTGDSANLAGLDVKVVHASLEDSGSVLEATRGVDTIVHLGALGSVPRSVADPLRSNAANLTGTLNVLEAAREHSCHVMFSSSSSVYGANTKLPKSESDWTLPLSPYAASKLGAESYVLAYQATYDLPTLAFRFFNVYGPRQSAGHAYAAVVPKFVEAAIKNESLIVHGDGTQSRDFTNVATVCNVLIDAISQKVTSATPVNLAFGTNTTLLRLIELLELSFGRPLEVTHTASRAGDVRRSQADGIKIRELFPNVVPKTLDEGIPETVDWYLQHLGR